MATGAEQLLLLPLCLTVCQPVSYKLLFGVPSLHVKPRSQQDLAGGRRLARAKFSSRGGLLLSPG